MTRPAAALPILLAVSIVRLWLMPLPSSFWVDETATVFVVRHGADSSLAIAPQVPASVYYYLPRISQWLPGPREVVYRIPSVLAMLAALWFIYHLAARLISPDVAWLAVFTCLSLRGFNYQAADARPYALGTLTACAGLWFLIRWLDTARWRDALGFVLCGALLWRVQLIFWPFYLVFGVCILERLLRRDTRINWARAGMVIALVTLTLVPVLVRSLALFREARAHVVVVEPALKDLVYALKLGMIGGFGIGAWLLGWYFRWQTKNGRHGPPPAVILAWWLAQPLGLFAFSHLTGDSVFVTRYLWLALPGAVFCAIAIASRHIPADQWKPITQVVALVMLANAGEWDHPWLHHHNSNWRAAAKRVREVAGSTDIPVLCTSPFIEARPPEWRPNYPLPGFLYAHLEVYPLAGRLKLLPFDTSPEAEAYAADLATRVFPESRRFLIYGGSGNVRFWREWFEQRPELAGWRAHELGPFGDVELVEFDAPGTASSHPL